MIEESLTKALICDKNERRPQGTKFADSPIVDHPFADSFQLPPEFLSDRSISSRKRVAISRLGLGSELSWSLPLRLSLLLISTIPLTYWSKLKPNCIIRYINPRPLLISLVPMHPFFSLIFNLLTKVGVFNMILFEWIDHCHK